MNNNSQLSTGPLLRTPLNRRQRILLWIFAIGLPLAALTSSFNSSVWSQKILLALFGAITFILLMLTIPEFDVVIEYLLDKLPSITPSHTGRTFIKRQLTRLSTSTVTRIVGIVLLIVLLLDSVAHIPSVRDGLCQRTPVSVQFICGDAFNTTIMDNVSDTLNGKEQVEIGIIDNQQDAPFDLSDKQGNEAGIDNDIFTENQRIASLPHMTLAVITMLSRTADDNELSADVGLEDLKGAYLFQRAYNASTGNMVKLRLVIGNIGTRLVYKTTVPIIMGHVALLAKQDSTFRGIIGLPFSSSTQLALTERDNLGIQNIPIISQSTTSDDLSNYQNFYRITSSNKTQSCVLLDFIGRHLLPALQSSSLAQSHIAVFRDSNDSYTKTLADDVDEERTGNIDCKSYSKPFATSNIQTFPELYTVGSTDFTQQIDDAIRNSMDVALFTGYADDLNKFEVALQRERVKYHLPPIPIVGGDALYEVTGKNNVYTNVYTTIYTPSIYNNNPFVSAYTSTFGNATLHVLPNDTFFPPHAVLTYDATHAFFDTIVQKATAIPDQITFDTLLKNIDINGLSGPIQFTSSTDNLKGTSDPLNKNIYVMCINTASQTIEVASYIPGPAPTITVHAEGQHLLACAT